MQKRNKYWSDWIKKARKELGLTQLELAREFAKRDGEKDLDTVSKERVSKVEHGATTLSLSMYLEICEMLIEKRYQERQRQAEQNEKFYKAPEILNDGWWDILKWYEVYEKLSEQQGNTEAIQFVTEQKEELKIKLQKEIREKEKCISDLQKEVNQVRENYNRTFAHNALLEEDVKEAEVYKKLQEEVELLKRQREEYLGDGQINLFVPLKTDREKLGILISLLMENGIKVPENCKF